MFPPAKGLPLMSLDALTVHGLIYPVNTVNSFPDRELQVWAWFIQIIVNSSKKITETMPAGQCHPKGLCDHAAFTHNPTFNLHSLAQRLSSLRYQMKKIGLLCFFFLNICMRLSELKEDCCGPWKEGLWGYGPLYFNWPRALCVSASVWRDGGG